MLIVKGVGKRMKRGTGVAALGIACLMALTGCTSADVTQPTASPSASATITLAPDVPGVKYAFVSGDAISNAPPSMAVRHGKAYLDVAADGNPHAVGACKVALYAPIFDTTTAVTVGNQRTITREILNGYLMQTGVHASIRMGTLLTNEVEDGMRQRVQTLTATYTQDGNIVVVHARMFTNHRAIIYVQQCPKHATLNATTTIRLNTA